MDKGQATAEIWRTRIPARFARQLEDDGAFLGLHSRSEIVREALVMLHRSTAERRMADGIAEFYGGKEAPLPDGLAK